MHTNIILFLIKVGHSTLQRALAIAPLLLSLLACSETSECKCTFSGETSIERRFTFLE